jgi:hypothetical protein
MSLEGLFALSAAVRLVGLLPLILVREPRSLSLRSESSRLFVFSTTSTRLTVTLTVKVNY